MTSNVRCLLAGLAALASAWQMTAAERNVILIITDDESPTLGCYGDPVAKTPNVDALAADGMLFHRAYATAASCSASRSAVLSGLFNHRNGQYGHTHDEHHFVSFEDIGPLTMPRAMSRAGYRTGHIGKFHVAPESTYRFDHYFRANERNPVAMAEAVAEFVTAEDERPFLLYFAPGDPHRSGGFSERTGGAFPPNLFGNREEVPGYPGVTEVVFDPSAVPVPEFLPDTPETRQELAQYYQSSARIDQGVGRLIALLKAAGLYDKTLIIYTSDHGMAFPGAKTTVYEAGLAVPMVARDPYQSRRGVSSDALVSLVDLTPTVLDFAGALDRSNHRPKGWEAPVKEPDDPTALYPNTGYGRYAAYQGRSWYPLLADPAGAIRGPLLASHTFHEIQMYYPMRAVWDKHYRLIWNIAYQLPFPLASDLWSSATWQAQAARGPSAPLGHFTLDSYQHRAEFELYDVSQNRYEQRNLAADPAMADVLAHYKELLQRAQRETEDPWLSKWSHE